MRSAWKLVLAAGMMVGTGVMVAQATGSASSSATADGGEEQVARRTPVVSAETPHDEAGGGAAGVYGGGGVRSGQPMYGAGGYVVAFTTSGGVGPGFMLDMGGVSAGLDGRADAVFSLDGSLNFLVKPHVSKRKKPLVLYAEGGYSDFFRAGSALNYGGGVLYEFKRDENHYQCVRVGYRNAWFPAQGNVGMFRLAFEMNHAW